MKIGFVVLTYNRTDALLAVLRALAAQCPANAQVVIADDGSRPDQVAMLREGLPAFACPVRHVWHPDTGFTAARARNQGAAVCAAQDGASGAADYLIFIDGDCIPRQGFVHHHQHMAEPGSFVNGSRVLLSEDLTRRVLSGQIDPTRLGWADWLRLRLAGDVNKLTHLIYLPHAPGRVQEEFAWKGIRSCNFGVWYRDFEAVNGFDESFSGWGHEDADLVLRLHQHGCRRKNGFLATEVLHLWHGDNSRADEAANRQRVLQRMQSGPMPAPIGLAQLHSGSQAVVTDLN